MFVLSRCWEPSQMFWAVSQSWCMVWRTGRVLGLVFCLGPAWFSTMGSAGSCREGLGPFPLVFAWSRLLLLVLASLHPWALRRR